MLQIVEVGTFQINLTYTSVKDVTGLPQNWYYLLLLFFLIQYVRLII